MAITERYDDMAAHDGGTFAGYVAVPESGSGPGVLVFQEIFGINDNMRGLADRLAEADYVALVPDMFWRIEPRFERKDESGLGDAMGMVMQYDMALGVADINSAHTHLVGLAECTGKIGAMGFCFGGAAAFVAAATSRVDGHGPDAAVCYYGSGINDALDLAPSIECPTMFHYGVDDPFIPVENIDAVEHAVAGLPAVEFHRYAAGHAFSNEDAPSMYDAAAADLAWTRTLDFLGRHLSS